MTPVQRFPLGEVIERTELHRLRLQLRHIRRAERAQGRAIAAWDAQGRLWHPERSSGVPVPLLEDGKVWAAALVEGAQLVRRVRRRTVPRSSGGVKVEASLVDVPAHEAHASSAKWHASRADGQLHRKSTVAHCGDGRIRVTCSACGQKHEAPVACSVVRLCPSCTRLRAKKQRARLSVAMQCVLANIERRGGLLPHRKGGPLGQRHIVLTVPHVVVAEKGTGAIDRRRTAEARIELLYRAWPFFRRALGAWLEKPWRSMTELQGDAMAAGSCWHRAFEWTPGGEASDGCGHPHFHMWCLSPFLPEYDEHRIERVEGGKRYPTTPCDAQGVKYARRRAKLCALCKAKVERRTGLRSWWVDALEQAARKVVKHGAEPGRGDVVAGRSRFDLLEGWHVEHSKVIVSVRRVWVRQLEFFREVEKDGNHVKLAASRMNRLQMVGAGGELIAYLEGWNIAAAGAHPDVVAGVYCALEGRRLSQSSTVTLKVRDGRYETVGLMAVADSLFESTCKGCGLSAIGELGAPPSRRVEVETWDRRAVAADASLWAPPATGPPPEPPRQQTIDELVSELQRAERAPENVARAARLAEVCELVRQEGPGLLPIYRRTAPRARPARRGVRDRMRALMRRERKASR